MLEELKETNLYISEKINKYKYINELIENIEKDADENDVPIISKEIREYLKFIIKSNKDINLLFWNNNGSRNSRKKWKSNYN